MGIAARSGDAPLDAPTVCYLTGEYPAVSHTFIDREIQAMRQLGVAVETVSLHRTAADRLLTDHDRAEAARTWAIQPIDVRQVLRAHGQVLRRAPAAYFRALVRGQRLGAPGTKGALRKLFYWAEAVVLAEYLHRRSIQHVHVHFANSASWVAMLASQLTGGTWSFTMHGPTEFDDAGHFALRAKIRDAAFVACIGDFCRSQLMRQCSEADWKKLAIVRCGVDDANYRPRAADEGRADGPARILSVGRLMADKGQRVLLDALAELRAQGVSFRMQLVGDGPDRAELEHRIAHLGLGDVVDLLGSVGQDRLPDLYRASDLFVLPSFAEGIPVVLMEALASGVPVVATSLMGRDELVLPGVTGRLAQPGRPDDLARQMRGALDEPEATARMVAAAQARVASTFSYPDSARPLAEQFERVAATQRTS